MNVKTTENTDDWIQLFYLFI